MKELLSGAQNPDTIIEAVPELSDAGALARSLAFLRTSYPGQVRCNRDTNMLLFYLF